MKLNLNSLWNNLTHPFYMASSKLSRQKARSRRAMSRLSQERKKLTHIKLARMAAFGGLFGVVAMVIMFFGAFAWFSRELPKPGEVIRRDGFSSRIYDRDDVLLYDLYTEERRTPISIDDVPEHLKQATIAVEDKDFYRHQGFDFWTVVRIPYNYIIRRQVVGGSTLTQQLVKNALLTNERSIQRKFKELVLSLQIERTFTKDQILEMYLNEAPYGGTAWGVGTASEIYFGKQVSDLDVVESAILAGLPQRPSAYSPHTGRTDADGVPLWKIRTLGVLRRMMEDDYLTKAAHQEAVDNLEEIEFEQARLDIKAPHFVFYIRDKLEEMFGQEAVQAGGFRVTTSLDYEIQKAAEDIIAEEIEKVEALSISNGAALVMEPNTGEIIAMVGSRDYFNNEIGGQFNVTVDALRQPGSSIKPITYLGLLQRGYTPASILLDVPTNFQARDSDRPYEPRNYDGSFRGPMSLRLSLANSLNIPAVKALAIVGLENFLNLSYDMGITTFEPSPENLRRFGLAVTLGGAEVKMIEMTSAYSSFANGGKRIEPVSILKIEDKNGRVIFEHRPVTGRQVIQAEEAFLINNILSDNQARSIVFGSNSLLNVGRGVAVKTGTTNDIRDNWAIGWSQSAIVNAWVGNNDNSQMGRVASGVSGATPIWRRIMMVMIENGYSASEWQPPDRIEQTLVNSFSGYPEHSGFSAISEYVIRGTLPSLPDPIHTKLKLCRGEMKLANDARVAAGDYDEREFFVLRENDPVSQDGRNRWQESIDAWVAGREDERYRPPTEYCGDEKEIFVRISKPDNEKSLNEENVAVHIEAESADGIEKIEIWVNGSLRETINDRRYRGNLNLPAGQYELYAMAISRSGEKRKSNAVKIGTGGQDWKVAPSPSPSPTLSSSPTPSPVIPTPPLESL